ncbi:hypothetical protein [Aquimarina sp. SS2-1]|uniref:hypothetical protein n=1 Tax=Aquimarina besae TaxID=3342247 RepID=UPI0036735D25
MKHLKTLLVATALVTNLFSGIAQSKTKSYSFNKGEVLDIIFLTTKPDVKQKIQHYFKTAFPVAERLGYHSLKGFTIKESPTLGNYHPQAMIFGYWNDLNGRQKFLETIEQTMPDFHQERRNIWSTFDLTYYEMKENTSFEINTEKHNVVTSYWQKDPKAFQEYIKELEQKVRKAGGLIKVVLTNGRSPKGYYHNPDYLTIIEWRDPSTFEKFYAENLTQHHPSVLQVNQFKIN